jgi:hypothetical protein
MSLVPVPSQQGGASCANCGAPLLDDQRYCLSCGEPASPVRLAFLDVLQNDPAGGAARQTIEVSPAGYVPLGDSHGANGWLRRNSGLLSLIAVLVLCLIAGLLVGHWVSQSSTKTPAKQVVEVKGLSGLAATQTSTPSTTTSSEASESKTSSKEAAEAKKEQAKETKAEKAPPKAPVKIAPAKIKKLTNSTGAKHQKEIDELGATPIETG